LSQSTCICIN